MGAVIWSWGAFALLLGWAIAQRARRRRNVDSRVVAAELGEEAATGR